MPYDGQLRLQAYSPIASGANMVEYREEEAVELISETVVKPGQSLEIAPWDLKVIEIPRK